MLSEGYAVPWNLLGFACLRTWIELADENTPSRHRRLPYDLDRAVSIPGEEMVKQESERQNRKAAQPTAEIV